MLGQRLKDLRRGKGITQQELAKELHVIQSAITQWECDKTDPNIENIKAIAIFYKVSADYILGLEDESGRKLYNLGNNVENNYGTVNQYNK